MPSIGNIVVKRITEHRLLPPVYEPIVKHAVLQVVQEAERVHHALVSLIGAGGTSPKPHKEVLKFITQTVNASDSVTPIITSGVVGISYTQTSFTYESYTIAGAPKTKGLIENISITEPLSVRRVKTRSIFEDAPELTELSATLTIERTKARGLVQTNIIGEALTVLPQTNLLQTLIETDNISESVTILKDSKRLQADTVSVSGDVTFTLPGAKLTLTETVAVSESIVRVITYGAGRIARELIENIAINEAVTTRITKTRSFTEIIPLADNVLIEITSSILERTLDETVQESHTLRIERTKRRSTLDATIIIDSVTGAWISANDIIVTDQVTFAVGRGRRLTENVDIIG